MRKFFFLPLLLFLISFYVSASSNSIISQQPVNYTAALGEPFYFYCYSSVPGARYQWQSSSDGGFSWIDRSSHTPTISTNTYNSFYSLLWRCVVTTSAGTAISHVVSILPPKTFAGWMNAAISSVLVWVGLVVSYVVSSDFKIFLAVSISISLIFFVNYFVKSKFNF